MQLFQHTCKLMDLVKQEEIQPVTNRPKFGLGVGVGVKVENGVGVCQSS